MPETPNSFAVEDAATVLTSPARAEVFTIKVA